MPNVPPRYPGPHLAVNPGPAELRGWGHGEPRLGHAREVQALARGESLSWLPKAGVRPERRPWMCPEFHCELTTPGPSSCAACAPHSP